MRCRVLVFSGPSSVRCLPVAIVTGLSTCVVALYWEQSEDPSTAGRVRLGGSVVIVPCVLLPASLWSSPYGQFPLPRPCVLVRSSQCRCHALSVMVCLLPGVCPLGSVYGMALSLVVWHLSCVAQGSVHACVFVSLHCVPRGACRHLASPPLWHRGRCVCGWCLALGLVTGSLPVATSGAGIPP